MAKQVRLTLAKALAKANLRRAEAGEKAITMNGLAVAAGVAATTITRLARNDQKAASALSLDLAGKVVTVLDCGIEVCWRLLRSSYDSNLSAIKSHLFRNSEISHPSLQDGSRRGCGSVQVLRPLTEVPST